MNVVCVGDCGIDQYLATGEAHCGGISLNFAIAARRAFPAADVISVVSAVGDDSQGDRVLARLRAADVDVHVAVQRGRTALQPIAVTAEGDRVFRDYDAGVLASFVPDEAAKRLIAAADLVAVPMYRQIQALFQSVMRLPTKGIRAVDFADIGDDLRIDRVLPFIDRLDIAFFGISVNDTAFIDELKRIAVAKNKLFVITLGAGGSIAVTRSGVFTCEAVPVTRVVDTTGAGDAFAAAFLAVYCHDGSIDDALAAGAARAAEVITRLGAQ